MCDYNMCDYYILLLILFIMCIVGLDENERREIMINVRK